MCRALLERSDRCGSHATLEVNLMFLMDWFKNFNYTVPTLLEDGVSVMIYAGEMDFICNWIRQQAMDDSTELAWQSGVQRSPRRAIPGSRRHCGWACPHRRGGVDVEPDLRAGVQRGTHGANGSASLCLCDDKQLPARQTLQLTWTVVFFFFFLLSCFASACFFMDAG
ncbi:putative serine carboxypeptidase (CBP1) [Trypanosoma cruzi]|uniref:Putative serine carboxypeptidase (CBP1) n=1 Tax=Trypanosoma cruzi TaxID=5693 RepID=A0A2V2XJN5_TRYCR|nr:putative serine carboxypeptidase (CBP1) [Trypanosoma cruzi]